MALPTSSILSAYFVIAQKIKCAKLKKMEEGRYSRQTLLKDFGEESARRLSEACVCVVGAGGVASGAIPLLAGSGLGLLKIADDDTVALHNLHRQTMYTEAQCGMPKVRAAAEFAHSLNGDCRIEEYAQRICGKASSFEDKFFDKCSLCIDTSDSFKSRFAVSSACAKRKIKLIEASAEAFISQIMLFGDGFYLDSVVQAEDIEGENAKDGAIFGPSAALSGVWAATEAILHIAGASNFNIGKFMRYDAKVSKFTSGELL